jgi:hypothetical protein
MDPGTISAVAHRFRRAAIVSAQPRLGAAFVALATGLLGRASRQKRRGQSFLRQVRVELRPWELDRREGGLEPHHRAPLVRGREPHPGPVSRERHG